MEESNMNNTINTLLISVIFTAITNIVSNMLPIVSKKLSKMWNDFTGMLTNLIYGKNNKICIDNVIYSNSMNYGSLEKYIITDIANKSKQSSNMRCSTGGSVMSLTPQDSITYDSVSYSYDEDEPCAEMIKNGIHKISKLTLNSRKYSCDQLFDIVKEYKDKYSYVYDSGYMGYVTMSSGGNRLLIDAFKIKYEGNIQDIPHSNVRNLLINKINDYNSGKINRINIMLYGQPGTGKTTIIKKIISELNAVVMNIKLSNFKDISYLRYFMFSKTFSALCADENLSITLRPKYIVNIFEDFDADLQDVLMKRKNVDSDITSDSEGNDEISSDLTEEQIIALNDLIKKNNINTSWAGTSVPVKEETSTKKKDGGVSWALDDILNLLDGVLPLNNVINIFTTNCIDSIDPAFYRPGRMDICEHIGELSTEDISNYISKNVPEMEKQLVTDIANKIGTMKISVLQDLIDENELMKYAPRTK